jgi:TonB family protein
MLKLAVAGVVVIVSVFGLSELQVFNRPAAQPTAQTETVEGTAVVESKPAVEPPAAQPEPEQSVKEIPAKTVAATPKLEAQPKKSASAPAIPAAPPARQTLVAQNTTPNPPSIPQQQTLTPSAPPVTAVPVTPQVNKERQAAAPPVSTPPSNLAPNPKPEETSVPITPPRAIGQFAPVLSEKVRRTIVGEAVVRVKVSVDTAGRVTSAESVTGGSPIPEALAGAAVNAVKRWQFEPARRGGEKVPGNVVLSFTFRK